MLHYIKLKQPLIQQTLLILFVLTIPFSARINSLIMLLIAINFLIEGNYKNKLQNIKSNKFALLLIGLYCLHAVGVLYSSNISMALYKLEKTASFLLFPMVLGSQKSLSDYNFQQLLKAFLLSCTLACTTCLGYGLYHFFFLEQGEFLFYHPYSAVLGIHAVYLSMFLLMGICICYYLLKRSNATGKAIIIFLMLFFMLNIIFLSSKMIIASSFLFINFLGFQYLSTRLNRIKIAVLALGINLLCAAILYNIPTVKQRFADVFASNPKVVIQQSYDYDTPFSGLTIRLVFWKSVLMVLQQENAWLFGVGTGDSQHLLDQTYKSMNLYSGNEELGDKGYLGYNTHSQFFANLLKLGLFGLLYFGCILVLPVINRKAFTNKLHLCFLFIICLTCLSEEILEYHRGIAFFAFFYSMLIVNQYSSRVAKATAMIGFSSFKSLQKVSPY